MPVDFGISLLNKSHAEFGEKERQAREIPSWGSQIYVKIPITNTRRNPA